MNSFSKVSAVLGLTLALLIGSANLAKAESREQTVNELTDWLFYQVNPELNNRPLRSSDNPRYLREWRRLREAIDRRVIPSIEACGLLHSSDFPEWEFSPINGQSFESTYDSLTDVIFYSRHPERRGRQIQPNERAAAREWSSIRDKIYISTCGI